MSDEPTIPPSTSTPAAPNGAATPAREASRPRRKRVSIIVFLAVLVAVGAVAAWFYIRGLNIEHTDDAFIAGNVYTVSPKISGRLKTVLVNDNQVVEAGQVVAEIDPADLQAALDQARAALALTSAQLEEAKVQVGMVTASTAAAVSQAQADVSSAEARVQQEQAERESASAEAGRAEADLERYSKLSEQAVSRQRLDIVRSTSISAGSALRAAEKRLLSAQAELDAAKAKLTAAQADVQRVEVAKADVKRYEAAVERDRAAVTQADLMLSYARIVAPAAGRITNKAAQPGDYVRDGRVLMSLVAPDVWVVANFKETQLRDMRPGQKCDVHVDAYGVDLPGHVESVQAGSGAAFSLLPPQNATGNYVKVVQRVPVKIVFDNPEDARRYLLGPGMSVEPRVHTK